MASINKQDQLSSSATPEYEALVILVSIRGKVGQ